MGIIADMLKDIPLTAVLRERLLEQESKMTVLEAENMKLKSENANLKSKLQEIDANKTVAGDPCPYCQKPMGKVISIKPQADFADMGLKILGSSKNQ
jgi:hypothetical protein